MSCCSFKCYSTTVHWKISLERRVKELCQCWASSARWSTTKYFVNLSSFWFHNLTFHLKLSLLRSKLVGNQKLKLKIVAQNLLTLDLVQRIVNKNCSKFKTMETSLSSVSKSIFRDIIKHLIPNILSCQISCYKID